MSTREGVSRIALTIRYLGYAIGLLLIVGGGWGSRMASTPDDRNFLLWGGIVTGILIGGAGHLLAWIIDGFASDR